MASSNDVRLLSRVVAGDPNALEELISAYRPFVRAILVAHLDFSDDEADELFQRFLIRIWENDFRRLRQWRGETHLASYLAAIARNLAHDFRRGRRFESLPHDLDAQGVDLRVEFAEKEWIEAAMSELTHRDRELIQRRYYLDQSYREIATALGITINHTGVALRRAQDRLRQALEKLQ